MTFVCENCDKEILQIPVEYEALSLVLGKKIKRYTNNDIKLDEVDKTLNIYIAFYKKDYDIHFIICRFKLEFDNIFTVNVETNYTHNLEGEKINIYLLYAIKILESMGHNFSSFINQMTISILNDKCNITYESYIKYPMSMCERRINKNIA